MSDMYASILPRKKYVFYCTCEYCNGVLKYDQSPLNRYRWGNVSIDAIFFLGIIKAHYNIVKTRPFDVNCGNINAIAMSDTYV